MSDDSANAEVASGSAPRRRFSRRTFLAVSATTGVAAVVGGVGGALLAEAANPPRNANAPASPSELPAIIPFEGIHQAGVDRPTVAQPTSILAAFDVTAIGAAALGDALREITARSRLLASGWSPPPGDELYPPPESGIVGSSTGPADLTVMLAVGASLFDGRFGLASRRPKQLTTMPSFPNDILDPTRTHGDLLLQVCATDEVGCLHALRYVMAGTRGSLSLRWMAEGFRRPNTLPGGGHSNTRNLLGFKDGTANPAMGTDVFNGTVWVTEADGEPGWAVGGSYVAVRIIRMFVERWDRTALGEQEALIGRNKRIGAPLGGNREEDIPNFAADPTGATIPLDSHIRRANPRTAATDKNLIFRRGYSYSRGFDAAGLLDQGLIFSAFQHNLEDGFVTVQNRLTGEALNEYIRPVGGGYFYVLPGVVDASASLGDRLLA